MFEALKGKKTYIVAALMVLVGIVEVLAGDMSSMESILENTRLIFEGILGATIRMGIATGPTK